jgi:hypothetical protein
MILQGQEVIFGQCYDTFALSYAINSALQQEGISVDKVHYSWKYINGCFNTTDPDTGYDRDWCDSNLENRVNPETGEILDTEYAEQFDYLTVTVEITDANGDVIETRVYSYDTWYDWRGPNSHSDNEVYQDGTYWQVEEDFIQLYDHTNGVGSIYTPDSLGDATFRVVSKDGGSWDGHYGPVIRDGKIWFTYRANPCAQTALYDPSCDGYSEAYAEQEYNNNCSANALYDPGCSGYQQAYYNQQCSNDPLYDSGCNGYSEAYYNQQCDADPLYDSGCDGYSEAYYSQQCSANSLYDSGCPGYDTAYYNYQCNADPLYDSGCDGHYDAQCEANTLYDFQCPGYDVAFFDQQCLFNPQYDTQCNGYVAPVVEPEIVIVQPALPLIIMPQPPAPIPQPIELPPVVEVEVEAIEPQTIQNIEAEVEAEIAQLEAEVEPEQPTQEDNTNEETGQTETSEENGEAAQENAESVDTEANTEEPTTTQVAPTPKQKQLTAKQKQKAKERKMRQIVKNKLKQLAVTMGEAVSLADQQALQAQITALINYVPGFNAYGRLIIPGVDFYQHEDIYKNKKIPENNRGLLNGLANQILHEKMVEQQYEK